MIGRRLMIMVCSLIAGTLVPLTGQQKSQPDQPTGDYYNQLLTAGGLSKDVHFGDASVSLNKNRYVCFDDNLRSGGFFTFTAERYSDEYGKYDDQMAVGTEQERKAALKAQMVMQRESRPVDLMMKSLFELLEKKDPQLAAVLRKGSLSMHLYFKGVQITEENFVGEGKSSWIDQGRTPPLGGLEKIEGLSNMTKRLSIEPTTLRYLLVTTFENGKPFGPPSSGSCEEIPIVKDVPPPSRSTLPDFPRCKNSCLSRPVRLA